MSEILYFQFFKSLDLLLVVLFGKHRQFHFVYFMITTFDHYQNYSHNAFIKIS